MLSSGIKKVVEEQYGQTVRYPVECDALASDISKCTGRSISASTIKRLWGFIDGATSARSYTLDTLAEYCGHGCFDDLVDSFNPMSNSKPSPIKVLAIDELEVGTKVVVTFGKGRLSLFVRDNRSFEVKSGQDCQLKEGDTFTCIRIEVGLPIFICDWCNAEENMGSYTIAKLTGVSSISFITEPSN